MAEALVLWGHVEASPGCLEEALADFDEQALEIKPRAAFALLCRGAAKRRLGRLEEAILDFDLSLHIAPHNFFALKCGGVGRRMRGRYDEAIADLDQDLQMVPEDAFAKAEKTAVTSIPQCAWSRGRLENVKSISDTSMIVGLSLAILLVRLMICKWTKLCKSERREAAKRLRGCYDETAADLDRVVHMKLPDVITWGQETALTSSPPDAPSVGNVKSIRDTKMLVGNATFDIIGAGPVGPSPAISLAKLMSGMQICPPSFPITIHEAKWISQDDGCWRRGSPSRARDRVVTLQDAVVRLFPEEVAACLEGERIWMHSRNVHFAQIEDRRCKYPDSQEAQAALVNGLNSDFIVAADGVASLSQQAFPRIVCPQSTGCSAAEERILGVTDDSLVENFCHVLRADGAVTQMLESDLAAHGFQGYKRFTKRRLPEMQGYSASRMRRSLQLDWGDAFTRHDPGSELNQEAVAQQEQKRRSFLQQCKLWRAVMQRDLEAVAQQEQNRRNFLQQCKLWRTLMQQDVEAVAQQEQNRRIFLQQCKVWWAVRQRDPQTLHEQEQNRRIFLQHCELWRAVMQRDPEAWPHAPINGEALEGAALGAAALATPLALHLMVRSAAENEGSPAVVWPTSRQAAAEVGPAEDEHWRA